MLGERGCVRIVLDRDGDTEAVTQPVAEGDIRERDVDGVDRLPLALVDRRWNADPDGADVVIHQAVEGVLDLRNDGVFATRIGRAHHSLADDTFVVDDPGKQLRAPKVERDDTGGSHGLRLR